MNVTPTALKNFKKALSDSDKKYIYQITEEASEDILKKISAKIKKTKNSNS